MSDDDQLKRMMNRWSDGYAPDPLLEAKVMAQARRAQSSAAASTGDIFEWLRALWGRPVAATGFAAIFLLAGVGLSQLISRGLAPRGEDMTLSYRLSIDPIYRVQAMAGLEDVTGREAPGRSARGAEAQVLTVGLDWLQSQLRLSDGQYQRVSALHETYEQSFDELFIELLESYSSYRQVDRRRMSDDVIDYVQLYDLLQKQRRLSEESSRLTGELMRKVSEIISPEQRDRYQRLLESVYPGSAPAEVIANPRPLDA